MVVNVWVTAPEKPGWVYAEIMVQVEIIKITIHPNLVLFISITKKTSSLHGLPLCVVFSSCFWPLEKQHTVVKMTFLFLASWWQCCLTDSVHEWKHWPQTLRLSNLMVKHFVYILCRQRSVYTKCLTQSQLQRKHAQQKADGSYKGSMLWIKAQLTVMPC